ncbi:hypothetical protein MPSYJ_40210 [Mycolicibacterium psychrotolerans]|uniref:Uncharacterized protein n=1 Tax=Mycolicibacterium psychrotolerans TaxID=216929 RepID=A0A7I7MFJ6_9MYCO|nr:hypothetical protein MPSYJ_40210 [Mycolicibacterium psychrotolerans]
MRVPSRLMVIPAGDKPTDMFAIRVLVAVSITDIVPPPLFVTYALDPFGLRTTEVGDSPTATDASTLFVTVSITATFDADFSVT